MAIVRFVPARAAGRLMKDEIAYFEKAMVSPARPLVAVFGGAKISGKIEAINNVLGKVDKILIGGAMANTFFAALGYGVGKSLCETEMAETARQVLAGAASRKVRLYLPARRRGPDRLEATAATRTVPAQEIPEGMMALDVGPASSLLFREAIQDAKTIVWNGPMGAFETAPFAAGTLAIMRALASPTRSRPAWESRTTRGALSPIIPAQGATPRRSLSLKTDCGCWTDWIPKT